MKEIITPLIQEAIHNLQKEKIWPAFTSGDIEISYPTQKEHGDLATNLAFKLTKILRAKPMEIGEQLIRAMYRLPRTKEFVKKIDLLAPGFINFHLKDEYVFTLLQKILKEKNNFGKSTLGAGRKILVEFISANPTGPLTLANGRGGFTGDTLANVLAMAGWEVKKEYYLNDIGNQIHALAESVTRKKLQQQGVSVEYPENLYQGEYIEDIAEKIQTPLNKKILAAADAIEKIAGTIQKEVLEAMIAEIKRVITRIMGIRYHQWFRESSLYKGLKRDVFIEALKKKNIAYEKDGAVWFRTTKFGDDKDRVILKADGSQTYFFSDILYLTKRFGEEKYDHKIYILGADHHGYIKRLNAIASALGYPGKIDVLIMQMVRLMQGGKEVSMSKRKGTFVTIEEVIQDVGLDVARFFFLMYSANTHMDFNLDEARQKSEKNPVFYVQYAHARICSIEAEMKKRRMLLHTKNITPLQHDAEVALVKVLARFPEVVLSVAQTYETHKLPEYALNIAQSFHNFYTHCRVIEDGKLRTTRAYILKATKLVTMQVLHLMGISAPEKMEKTQEFSQHHANRH